MACQTDESDVIIELVDIVKNGANPAGGAEQAEIPCTSASNGIASKGGTPSLEEQVVQIEPSVPLMDLAEAAPEEGVTDLDSRSLLDSLHYQDQAEFNSALGDETIPEIAPANSNYEALVSDDSVEKEKSSDAEGNVDPAKSVLFSEESLPSSTHAGRDSDSCDAVIGAQVPSVRLQDEKVGGVKPSPEDFCLKSRLSGLEERIIFLEDKVKILSNRVESLECLSKKQERPIGAVEQPEAGIFTAALANQEGDQVDPRLGEQDVLTSLASLQARVEALEALPRPDEAVITQNVLREVRQGVERYPTEWATNIDKTLSEITRRIRELETRPTPEVILPELPDVEGVVENVLARLREELDSTVAAAAAKVLREEIAALRKPQ